MNTQLIKTNAAKVTMSSREIAKVAESTHSNIKISIERLFEKGVLEPLATQGFDFEHNGNTYEEYFLSERDSMIVVAQNHSNYLGALVDSWIELKKANQPAQLTLEDMCLAYLEKSKEVTQMEDTHRVTKMQIATKQVATSMQTASVATRKANKLQKQLDPFMEKKEYFDNQKKGKLGFHKPNDFKKIVGMGGQTFNIFLIEQLKFQTRPDAKGQEHLVFGDVLEVPISQTHKMTPLGEKYGTYIDHENSGWCTRSIRWNAELIKQLFQSMDMM